MVKLLCAGVGQLACLLSMLSGALAAAETEGLLYGRLTDSSGVPVAGATIRVAVAPGDARGIDPLRSTTSDAEGNYRLAVPIGHAQCLPFNVPGGYYAASLSMPAFVTTSEAPHYKLDYQLERGVPLALDLAGDLQRAHGVYLFRAKPAFHYATELTGNSKPVVTLPPDGGELKVSLSSEDFSRLASAQLNLTPEFRADRAKAVESGENGQFRIIDEAGHTATVEGAEVAIDAGQLVLKLHTGQEPEKIRSIAIRGQVLDEQGAPIRGATARFIYSSKQGGSSSPHVAVADSDGRFELQAPVFGDVKEQGFQLAITREGFAGVLTERVPIDKQEAFEQPAVRLKPGRSIQVRAVDPDGKPLEGAWVRAGSLYLSGASFVKTDRHGECTVPDLPEDVLLFHLRHGLLSHQSDVVVAGDAKLGKVLTLKLERLDKPRTAVEFPDPPPPGSEAPELTVVAWSDGQTRSLVDYRGKFVVLDFWGIWCSPCLNSIPAVKAIEEKYADNPEVVFLGIHSAGTDMAQVQALQKLKDWKLPSGLDRGESEVTGTLARAFGVRGWPTQVIIDRQGKIVFNSNWKNWTRAEVYQKNLRRTKALGLKPLPPNASEQEKNDRSKALSVLRLSELIDQALAGEAAK